MNELLSRVKLHWNNPVNLDIVRNVISILITYDNGQRQLDQELPYDQTCYEIVVQTPCKVEYYITSYNSINEGTSSETYSRNVTRSIRPNTPTDLAADIIADDLPANSTLSGIPRANNYNFNTRNNYSKQPAPRAMPIKAVVTPK